MLLPIRKINIYRYRHKSCIILINHTFEFQNAGVRVSGDIYLLLSFNPEATSFYHGLHSLWHTPVKIGYKVCFYGKPNFLHFFPCIFRVFEFTSNFKQHVFGIYPDVFNGVEIRGIRCPGDKGVYIFRLFQMVVS